MPIASLVYPADLAFINYPKRGENEMSNDCNCTPIKNCECKPEQYGEVGFPFIPVPGPAPFPVPVWPPMPPHPYPPYPIPPVDPDVEPAKGSVEAQICKLSKKASTISKMLENLEEKKKDVIIKVGEVSYNFGNIDLEIQDWDDGSYAATVKKILDFELAAIKAKIAELAGEIGDEITSSTDGPVAGNP